VARRGKDSTGDCSLTVTAPTQSYTMGTSENARLRVKSGICAAVVVASNVAGNFFLKSGMPSELATPLAYITVLFRPMVALGVLLLILWMTSRMTLLSWADLSYVLPLTSVGYVLVALAGRLLLHEQISARRWTGIMLIMTGVALVSGGTAPQTAAHGARAASESDR
jgi:drug/metabolite transporter (DMT)-like permease